MVDQKTVDLLQAKATKLRQDVLEMIGADNPGHLGGSYSLAEITSVLYFHQMKVNPKDPKDPDRDRFLLSKGHAALIQYAALAELGFFPMDWIPTVKEYGSHLQGHPDMTKTPGIEANTGSLGQGLSIACGMAMGLKLDNSPRRVYCIVGDGELAEGQIWEAAMSAPNFKLDNLVAIVDKNGYQAMGATSERFRIEELPEKFSAFGWNVLTIDGHNIPEIIDALDKAAACKGKPTVIIAKTVKGRGVSFAENTSAFHNAPLTAEQMAQAKAELAKQ